jgi:uncharacterized protein YxjI
VTVATVSKRLFAWTDTYGVHAAQGQDDILVLAATDVIDMACHGDQKKKGGGAMLRDAGPDR